MSSRNEMRFKIFIDRFREVVTSVSLLGETKSPFFQKTPGDQNTRLDLHPPRNSWHAYFYGSTVSSDKIENSQNVLKRETARASKQMKMKRSRGKRCAAVDEVAGLTRGHTRFHHLTIEKEIT